MTNETDPFDQLLTNALRARAEHPPMANIAADAIARAQLHQQRTARLARISFWTRFCSAAAILLVVATIAVAYWEWPTSTTSTTSEVTTSTDSSTTASTSSSLDMTTIGGGAFLLTLLAVAALMVLTPERPTWRLTPA
jgi:hypothetical protein